MKKIFLALVVCLAGLQAFSQSVLSEHQLKMMQAFHIVSPADIDEWAREFLKDEYRGRRGGDIGFDKAAGYVKNLFEEWGIQPKGDNGTFFNTFPQPYNDVRETGQLKAKLIIGNDTIVRNYFPRKEFFASALSDSGEVTGELVYVGYGITAPELNHDDFKGIDMSGKIVMVDGGYPYKGKNIDTLKMWSKYQRVQPKIAAAAAAGAKGLLFISPYSSPAPRQTGGLIVVSVHETAAKEMLAGTGRTLPQWRELFNRFETGAVLTGHIVTVSANTRFYPENTTANIVGMIEGSDPVLKNEYIIASAHLDHLGMLPEMYPGALDNASGSVIVMAAAKAIALSKVNTKRSILFVLFSSEELGILGASYFLKTMPFPKEKINCLVNLDMLGTGTGFSINGAKEWEHFEPFFRDASEQWTHRPFTANLSPWKFITRFYTDGNAFYNMEIPTFELRITGGVRPVFYHVPEDVITQLDPVIMADASRLLAIAMINIANR